MLQKVLDLAHPLSSGTEYFFLIDRRECPDEESFYRSQLKADDIVQPGFRGADPQDCQDWALKRWEAMSRDKKYLFFERNYLVIVDDRSLVDDTVLFQQFFRGEAEAWMFDEHGCQLPPKQDTWFEWRIKYQYAVKLWSLLAFGPSVTVHPVFYALKQRLTDADGVFDYEKADRLAGETDPFSSLSS